MMKELIDELVQSKPELCMKLYMQLVLVISEIDTQKEVIKNEKTICF